MSTAKNDIRWHEFTLISGDKSIDISTDPMFNFMYRGMNIEQSLFEGGISGTVLLRDVDPLNSYGDRITSISSYLKTGGTIKIAFSSPDVPDSFTELKMYITSIELVTNQMAGMYMQMGESTNRLYRLDFCSFEDAQIQPENRALGEDEWVGGISRYVREELGPKYFDGKPYEGQVKENQTTAKEPMEVDRTKNWIWLRPRYFLYPWGKVVKELEVDRLINNLAENAVDTAFNAPNFLFWQDFNKWYFKSITSLIRERYMEQRGYWQYNLSNDEGSVYRFDSIKSVKGFDVDDLVNSGSFSSKYKLVEPNYNSIYDGIGDADLKDNILINHLPDADGWTDDYRAQIKSGSQFHDTDPIGFRLRERDVVYDYRCDFLGLPMGPCTPEEGDDVEPPTDEETEFDETYAEFKRNSVLIGTKQPVDIEKEELFSKDLNEEYDDIYGWFNFSQYNNPNPTINDQFSYVEGKNQDILWQTMFDITPLDGNLLYDLRSIKTQLKRKRLAYSLITTLKQHWNYYRYSMCCSEIPSEQEAFAVLVGIETPGVYSNLDEGEIPIGGGPVPYTDQLSGEEGPADNSYTHDTLYWPIYRYAFYPVEIVPKWDPTLNYRATITTGSAGDEGDDTPPDPSGRDFLGRPCDAYHADGEPKRVYERYDPATLSIVDGNAQPNNTNNLYQLNHDHLEWFNINPNKNANYYAIPKGIQFEVERDEETDEIKSTLPYHPSFKLPDAASVYGTVSTNPDNQEFGGNRCKIKDGVIEGFFERGTNVAWNLNELSNFWTWTNPGINMYGEDYPNHPENFSMMPVGAVFGQNPTTSSPDPEINDPNGVISPPDETYQDESTKSSELLGRIVRLSPILKSEYELPLPFNDLPTNCSDEDDEEKGEGNGEGTDEEISIFPDSIKNEEGVSRDNGIFMIVNKIFGTKNLPKPFGGKKEDLQVFVREEDPDNSDQSVLVAKNYEQDCKFPISTEESTGTIEAPIYIFDVENAHDGNCEGTVAFGPYMSKYQLEEEEEDDDSGDP